MLVRLGVAGCILSLISTLLFALTALGGNGRDVLSFAVPYAFVCFAIVVFLGGEAVAAIRRSEAGTRKRHWKSWLAPTREDDPRQTQTPHDMDDLVGMLGDTVKLARRAPAIEAFEPIDVTELVGDLSKHPSRARLKVGSNAKAFHVLANRDAIARTFDILVENAIANGSQAFVSCDRGTSAVVVHVDDDGPGVARSERAHVFNWQYYMSTPRSRQTGCRADLVIARHIACAHGGDIVVGPSPLGGARYTVRLPLLKEHELVLAVAS